MANVQVCAFLLEELIFLQSNYAEFTSSCYEINVPIQNEEQKLFVR